MNHVIKHNVLIEKMPAKKNINRPRKILIGLDISQNNLKYWGL